MDNRRELEQHFTLRTVGERYASGEIYICNRCGRMAHSMEKTFPCKDGMIVTKVGCSRFPKCKNTWRLKITDDGLELPEGAHTVLH